MNLSRREQIYRVANWVIAIAMAVISVAVMPSAGLVSALNTFSVLFVFYCMFLVVELLTTIPPPTIYKQPVVQIPDVIDQRSIIRFSPGREAPGEARVREIVRTINTQIQAKADTLAIHSLVEKMVETTRRMNAARYAGCQAKIDRAAFAGFMGTIVGMIAFLAQTDVVLAMFGDGGEAMLSQLDLTGAATAFLTSFIGNSPKAWISKAIDAKQDAQEESLLAVERWLQDEILARLHLPSSVSTHMVLESSSLRDAVHDLKEAIAVIREASEDQKRTVQAITGVLGPKLQRIGTQLGKLEGMKIELELVAGGYMLRLAQATEEDEVVDQAATPTIAPPQMLTTPAPAPPRRAGGVR